MSPGAPPRTPKKTRSNDDVIRIINSLSQTWSLEFPQRGSSWSPMKVEGRRSTADDVFDSIRYLHYNKPEALYYALQHFEEKAISKCSQWVSKPRAEQDVTPSRNGSIRQPSVDGKDAAELMEMMLPIVRDVACLVKEDKDYRVYDKDTISEDPITVPKTKVSPMKQSKLSRYLLKESDLSPKISRNSHHPSSDEFNPDPDFSDILNDITMKDISAPTVAINQKESEDEEYHTPPTTPPASIFIKTGINEHHKSTFFQRPDPVSLPELGMARKRPHEEVGKPLASRKTRGRHASDSSTLYPANHLSPSTSPVKISANQNMPLRAAEDTKQAPHLSRSFNSFASTTSNSAKSSFSWPSVKSSTSTAQTTPNTSFRTESLGTSFDATDTNALETSFHEDELNHVFSEAKITTDLNAPRFRRPSHTPQGMPPLGSSKSVPASKPEKICHIPVDRYIENYLTSLPLLPSSADSQQLSIPLRQLYEITRVSKCCKLPLEDFKDCLSHKIDDYEQLWSLLRSIAKLRESTMPEKSSYSAWTKATNRYEGVSFTGNLKFSEKAKTPIFEFGLNPLRNERSHRLSREFGGDRFCTIDMPGISQENLPKYLKHSQSVAAAVKERIIDWLVDAKIKFLARTWRAFYVKSEKKEIRQASQDKLNEVKYRVYLFGGNEVEFTNFLTWFLPFKNNETQLCLKFFARLGLGVSATIPSIQFQSFEIIRTCDARADVPCVRRVFPEKQADVDARTAYSNSTAAIMNDGCAKISKAAALAIADMLGLQQIPCAFQGRIAGAKGLWMVDTLEEVLPRSDRNWWIEITDSQCKFEPHIFDSYDPKPRRVTFDVHSWSRKLSSSKANFQLLPILAHQGVPPHIFEHLLEEDLSSKVKILKEAMDNGIALRKWNQAVNPVVGDRVLCNRIEMQGGLPKSVSEKVNWFVEHGFEPGSCRYLRDIVYDTIKDYCIRLESKMNIELAKSTYAYMIADPLAILEEDEIHLGFSNLFKDPKDKWEEVMLHDIDVLVARLPASLPSDIQKVRSVFKPELRKYRDVIIFSSKGSCSLAHKLSGGDYDGDKAWVCWEPAIVDPFQNSAVPQPPPDEVFGFKQDNLRVSDLIRNPRDDPSTFDIVKFIKHGFDFNMQPSMLGICTVYHEALCYPEMKIDDPRAIEIAFLLGRLVDSAKAGVAFSRDMWNDYRHRKGLSYELPKPAYKDKGSQKPIYDNLIDKLVFKTAKNVREQALKSFSEQFSNIGTWDDDLVRISKSESELAKTDKQLKTVLSELKTGLEKITTFWSLNISHENPDGQTTRKSTTNPISFQAKVEKCRADFLSLQPTCPPESPPSSILRRWQAEDDDAATTPTGRAGAYWNLLKASVLYEQNHERKSVVWYTAGIELGEIKAKAKGMGTYRLVRADIHRFMKMGKIPDRALRTEIENGAVMMMKNNHDVDGDEDDAYGTWSWDE